jgi:hypothetical protein
MGSRKLDTILSSVNDQFRWLNSGAALVLKTYFACAAVLCCLASPAEAAGIQLIDSGPGLAGAIWYPCVGEPKDVALGKLALPVDIALTGVKKLSRRRGEAAACYFLSRSGRLVRRP